MAKTVYRAAFQPHQIHHSLANADALNSNFSLVSHLEKIANFLGCRHPLLSRKFFLFF